MGTQQRYKMLRGPGVSQVGCASQAVSLGMAAGAPGGVCEQSGQWGDFLVERVGVPQASEKLLDQRVCRELKYIDRAGAYVGKEIG